MEMLKEIPLELIYRNEGQPRTDFDQEGLEVLARSIVATRGVLEPIVVRPVNGRFEIVAGERRWRASKIGGLSTIKAVVRDVDDRAMALEALVENVVRQDLNVAEEGRYLLKLLENGVEWPEICEQLGMERQYLEWKANVVEKCVPEVVWLIQKGQLSGNTGARLAKLTANGQRRFLRVINQEPMTLQEQIGLVNVIWADENQPDLPLFEETKLTEEQVQASRSFAGMIDRTIGLCMKLEQMEEKAPGTLAAALATEIDRDIEKMGQLQSRLGKLRAVLQRHNGRKAGRKVA